MKFHRQVKFTLLSSVTFLSLIILVSCKSSNNNALAPSSNSPPTAPSNPIPANNATGVSTSPILRWSCSDPDNDSLSYYIYFGTDNSPSTQIATTQTGTEIARTGLTVSTTYYWKVLASDGHNTPVSSQVWQFTTAAVINNPPIAPNNPIPADNVTGQSTSLTLSWTCSDPENDTLTYDVLFGTVNPPTTQVSSAQTGTTLGRSGLINSTTYFWKVIANDGHNSRVSGPVWQFTIAASGTHTPGEEQTFPLGSTGQFIVMCWIPAGILTMGSPVSDSNSYDNERPQHQVTFATGYWMSKYEVTQRQWVAVMGSNPSYFRSDVSNPVECVSMNDIQAFNSSLGNQFSLPTESEWEYACRATTTARFYWGDDPNYALINQFAWYDVNSSSNTHSVGEKQSNLWGLFDLSGNVWEWCQDTWHTDYSNAPTDGSAWIDTQSPYRVLRGGSWNVDPDICRSAGRDYILPGSRFGDIGFRLVRHL